MEENDRSLNDFQIRNITLLTHLYELNAVEDEVVEILRKSELDYFSLLDKYLLLESKVNIDEKTNLLKYKKDYLTNIIKTASRIYFGSKEKDYIVSFCRFDIDNFSSFNNTYGHDVGDQVLVKVSNIIREKTRPTDYVIRFGGEELDVILPTTDINGAVIYINKILEEIRNIRVDYMNKSLSVTVSAGITSMIYSFGKKTMMVDSDIENLFLKLQKEADDALYEAKSTGKDKACIYNEDNKEYYIKLRSNYKKIN